MSTSFLIPDSKNFSPDFNEVARYLGYRRTTPPEADVLTLMKKAASEMQAVLKPQAVFEVFDLDCQFEKNDDSNREIYKITFADVTLHSKDLGANLKNCKKVALMAATIGPQVDALIRKYTSLDSVYASILQATGAMYIEDMLRAMPFLNVIATGNINIEDVPQYLKAGASAVGIGRSLYKDADANEIENRARRVLELVDIYKNENQQ